MTHHIGAPPGSSKDRGKTPVPTAAGPAPDHPEPLTRKRAAGITDTDDVLELLVPLNAVDADVTKEQDPGLTGGGPLDGLGPDASLIQQSKPLNESTYRILSIYGLWCWWQVASPRWIREPAA